MVKHFVIVDFQDFYGFSILQSNIKPNNSVFEGSYEECSSFYQDRIDEWVDSQEAHLC